MLQNVVVYNLVNEGNYVGCGGSGKIEMFYPQLPKTEAGCRAKCDADDRCRYMWYNPSSNKCVLYSSCDGKSEQYVGKRFEKKQCLD